MDGFKKKSFNADYFSELGLDEEEQALLEEFLEAEESKGGAEAVEKLLDSWEEENEEYEAANAGFQIDFEPSPDLDFVLAYANSLMKKKGIEEAADKELSLDISLEELLKEDDLDSHMIDMFMTEDWEDET